MMNHNLSSIPGYRINEYLLVLNPHEELRNRIMQVRKEFSDKFQSPHIGGRPHLARTAPQGAQYPEQGH